MLKTIFIDKLLLRAVLIFFELNYNHGSSGLQSAVTEQTVFYFLSLVKIRV